MESLSVSVSTPVPSKSCEQLVFATLSGMLLTNLHFSLSVFHSTCLNRIDLPLYDSLDDLREKLKLAVTMVATGFDIE